MLMRSFLKRHRVVLLFALTWSYVTLMMGQAPSGFPLTDFQGIGCRAKGRLQDCPENPGMKQILARGKDAIPMLIAQLSETGRTKEPVEDFWTYTTSGDVSYMLLNDLFTDSDGRAFHLRGVPDWRVILAGCSGCAEVCWRRYVHRHGMVSIQRDWRAAWKQYQSRVVWDPGSRCFRVDGK